MRVRIKKTCEHTGIKEGEIYKAERYSGDPMSKVVLLSREPDGYDPCCTEYFYNVEVLPGFNSSQQIPDIENQAAGGIKVTLVSGDVLEFPEGTTLFDIVERVYGLPKGFLNPTSLSPEVAKYIDRYHEKLEG